MKPAMVPPGFSSMKASLERSLMFSAEKSSESHRGYRNQNPV